MSPSPVTKPPLSDADRALIDQAIADGRMTICPPRTHTEDAGLSWNGYALVSRDRAQSKALRLGMRAGYSAKARAKRIRNAEAKT